MCPSILKLISSLLRFLYSRHVSIIPILRSSHMVGLLKSSSSQVSRTNMHMHTNEDIWEIRQIKGSRVEMRTKGPVTQTRVAMELAATRAGTMGPVMTQRAMVMSH